MLNGIATAVTSGMSAEQVIEHTLTQIHHFFPDLRVAYGVLDCRRRMHVRSAYEPTAWPALRGAVIDASGARLTSVVCGRGGA